LEKAGKDRREMSRVNVARKKKVGKVGGRASFALGRENQGGPS